MSNSDLIEKLMSHISPEPNSGCWLWMLADCNGYGVTHLAGRQRGVHRVLYELLVGPVPPGLQLDHLCRVRCCANPAHLEPVTCQENILRGASVQAANAKKTCCKLGHPFVRKVTRNGRAYRLCVTCSEASRERYLVRHGLKGKPITHCSRGHEFTEENTWIAKTGHRHCRICWRIRKRNAAAIHGWRPNKNAQEAKLEGNDA